MFGGRYRPTSWRDCKGLQPAYICESVDHLAEVYSQFHHVPFQECREELIKNVSNTMSDRVASNHAAIRLINESWKKELNELNCHLHPLDSVASSARGALKAAETSKGKLWGNDCFAANIVLSMNKLRYKDGKGDPMGFKTFLSEQLLGKGFIPRYRGNRLHVIFHICGKYFAHHDAFLAYLSSGLTLGGLRAALLQDFGNETAIVEMQVLGLFGKLLTGPWMVQFYTSASSEVHHIDGIRIVQRVLQIVKDQLASPLGVLSTKKDFFGNALDTEVDAILRKLQQQPCDVTLFEEMVKRCLASVVKVLVKQYDRYFHLDITEELKKQTESARSHNIDSEEVVGMFSAAQQRAPNATLHFLSSRIRAKKNCVTVYLDSLQEEQRDKVISFAVSFTRKLRIRKRTEKRNVLAELSRRSSQKRQKKQMSELGKIEKKLRALPSTDELSVAFPELENNKLQELTEILDGKCIGRNIMHSWHDDGTQENTLYCGRIEKLLRGGLKYEVAYWEPTEDYDDAEDYELSKYAIAADLFVDDLAFV